MDVDELQRQAHDAGYRFPAGFAGFTAAVTTGDGATGTFEVRGRKDVSVQLDTPEGDWVRAELASMVAHRWPADYAEADGRFAKELSDNGQLVTLIDDPYDSAYRIHDGAISEVHRTVGGNRFVIVIAERMPARDGRWLPARFSVFHWRQADGRLVRADHYRDVYTLVAGVHLPASREVTTATDDGLTSRTFNLTRHQLLGVASHAAR